MFPAAVTIASLTCATAAGLSTNWFRTPACGKRALVCAKSFGPKRMDQAKSCAPHVLDRFGVRPSRSLPWLLDVDKIPPSFKRAKPNLNHPESRQTKP